MRNTRKILFALLVVMTLMVGMFAVTASAAKTTVETTFYLTPNANWKIDNARFALYTWDGGEKWFDMSDTNGDGVYECTIPAGIENIIFCRMNPGATDNNWDNKWNQTGDLKYDGTNNHYTVKEGAWDKGEGTWGLIEAGECIHEPKDNGTIKTPATCTVDGEVTHTCSKCGVSFDKAILAEGHKYGNDGKCTECSAMATYIIAGDVMQVDNVYQTGTNFLGVNWDVTAEANKLEYDEATGKFVKTYTGVALGEYHIKVAVDKSWNISYGTGADNYYIKVEAEGSTVTITFDAATKTISHNVEAPHVHAHEEVVTAPTCTAAGYTTYTCSCGDTYTGNEIAALGHSFAEGSCSTCGAADPDYVAPQPPVANDKLINFSEWEEFAKGKYADGDTVKFNDIFTFIYGKNSRVDGSKKTFEDGLSFTLRFSFGGKTPTGSVPSKNALQITVDGAHTIKIWYVAGGDGRYFALMDSTGTVLSETTKETVQNSLYYSELEIPAAGTYYLGVPADNNYIFQIELVAKASEPVDPPHTHSWSDATCTEPQKCECGETQGEALGHSFTAGACSVCGAEDPNYVPPHVNTLVVGETNKIVIDESNSTLVNGYYNAIVPFTATEAGVYSFVAEGGLCTIFDAAGNFFFTSATFEANTTYYIYVGFLTAETYGELNVAVTKSEITEPDPDVHVNSLVVGDTNKIVITDALNNGIGEGYYIVYVPFIVEEAGHYEFINENLLFYIFASDYTTVVAATGKADLEPGTYQICICDNKPLTTGEYNVAVTKSEIVEPDPDAHKNALVLGDNKFVVTDDLIASYIEYIVFVAEADGKYTFTASEGSNFVLFAYVDPFSESWVYTDPYVTNNGTTDNFVSVNLKAGTYIVGVNYYYGGTVAGEYNINVAVGEYEEGGNAVVEKNKVVLGENKYALTESLKNAGFEFTTFVAEKSGYYTFTGADPLQFFIWPDYPNTAIGEIPTTAPYSWNVKLDNSGFLDSFTVYLEAGEYAVGFRYDFAEAGEYDYTITYSETDPNAAPEQPAPELTLVEKLVKAFKDFIAIIVAWFQNLFAGFKK